MKNELENIILSKHQAFKIPENNNSSSINCICASDAGKPVINTPTSHPGVLLFSPVLDLQGTNPLPPLNPVVERVTPSPLTPIHKHNNIYGYILDIYDKPQELEQIINRLYPQYSKDYLFTAVCRMTNEGGLRRVSDQGVMKWTQRFRYWSLKA